MNLLLEIITPEKVVYKEEIDEVIVPTINGEIAIALMSGKAGRQDALLY